MHDEAMSTVQYLDTEETNRRRELIHGWVREPPAPFFSHQQLVLKIARLLSDHVEPRGLGTVAISPLDVVLDANRALVVQPDVLFVSDSRLSIIHNQVWGAPDLVVEVFSDGTRTYDCGEKLDWYQQYGVRECWLVDLFDDSVTVVDFTGEKREYRIAKRIAPIRSGVFPDLHATALSIYA